jgi:hypothetical protein
MKHLYDIAANLAFINLQFFGHFYTSLFQLFLSKKPY